MWNWIKQLDRLLRGEATSLPQLRAGNLDVPVLGLSVIISILGLIYGACMGLFAITGSGNGAPMQIPASMLKVPLLFFLTLIVTFPSLYVFNALVGSRLGFVSVLRLLIGSLAITLAVLASLGPIVAFFSISTTSYAFMKLLNIVVFGLAGILGLSFLLQTLHRLTIAQRPPSETAPLDIDPNAPPAARPSPQLRTPADLASGALDPVEGQVLGPHVRTVFRIWVIVFGLVGAQMAWVLRPFIGNPSAPFVWFRGRESNFFQALYELLLGFLRGGR